MIREYGWWRQAATLAIALWSAAPAHGQTPSEPPADPAPAWTGSVGAGLSLTSGNTDTLTYNLTFELARNPEARHVLTLGGLYLRSQQNDVLNADRTSLSLREQFNFSSRTFVYGQMDYLRDRFKRIDSLVAPTAGVGYQVIESDTTRFDIDAGAGAVWEKNRDLRSRTSGAVTVGERLTHTLTETTTLKHAASALWKANAFADGLYTISTGIGVKVAERLQLTVEVLDTFKSRPPTAATGKNDVAIVLAITVKY